MQRTDAVLPVIGFSLANNVEMGISSTADCKSKDIARSRQENGRNSFPSHVDGVSGKKSIDRRKAHLKK